VYCGEIHDCLDQRFLNIEGQSGVVNNILKIAFLIFLIQGFVFLLISLCFIPGCMGLDDFVYGNYVYQMDLACTYARFKYVEKLF
jgi:hypothetical protein